MTQIGTDVAFDRVLEERPTLAPRRALLIQARKFLARCGVPECDGLRYRLLAQLSGPQLKLLCFVAATAYEAGRTENDRSQGRADGSSPGS